VPIHVNDRPARVNVINAPWFEATPEPESLELALADYFNEAPLDVIPIRMEHPLTIAGALYISPQRTPGFADESTVAVTVRRMVISRRVRDLLPAWGSFFRGILELEDGTPVASREDLVRDDNFRALRRTLEEHLYQHLEDLADQPGSRLESIVTWHRYHFAGAALSEVRLRYLLRRVYRFQTSKGPLLLDEILQQSAADPLYENDLESVVWYNADRRQERYLDELFSRITVPCVHAVRSFEESLLAEMLVDEDGGVELRQATPSARNFNRIVLGMTDPEDLAAGWQDYFSSTDARVMIASLASGPPVVAFLNDRYELARTFEELRREGDIPTGFQRLIDAHFRQAPTGRNEVVLNRTHRLVQNALRSGVSSPLASVLRVLVMNALTAAGAVRSAGAAAVQAEDLDWIADALRGPGA
jgi:molecular chaperone HtpG